MFEFITEMEPVDILVIALLWVVSVFVSTILMWRLVIPRFLRDIILDMLITPSEKTVKAVQSLVIMLITTPIKTGNKIKDEDGKETDEVVPLMTHMGRELFRTINHKMAAAKGGLKNKAESAMFDVIAQSGGDVRAALPLAIAAATRGDYGPAIAIILQELSNRPKNNTNLGGGLQ